MTLCDTLILSPPTLLELDLARNRKVCGLFFYSRHSSFLSLRDTIFHNHPLQCLDFNQQHNFLKIQ